METPNSIADMDRELSEYRIENSADLPAAVRGALSEAASQGSPVDRFVRSMEVLYAARGEINDAGLTIVGQLGGFCAMFGWPGGDPRPGQIRQAMCRDLGEQPPAGLVWPDSDGDPEPSINFAPPEQIGGGK